MAPKKKGRQGGDVGLGKALENVRRREKAERRRRGRDDDAVDGKNCATPLTAPLTQCKDVPDKSRSVVEMNDLSEFLNEAVLADRAFEAKKETRFVEAPLLGGGLRSRDVGETKALPVPRRPKYVEGVDAAAQDKLERESFLEWRRSLASMEESAVETVTPFEKNIEYWRQLWRVLEKCDVLMQVVDARDPLLYRCVDLETYCAEEFDPPKPCALLINKADFVDDDLIEGWIDYFSKNAPTLKVLFFSAKQEQDRLDEEEEEVDPREKVFDRESLLKEILTWPTDDDSNFTVGTVGYPNVGKSSLINVLLGAKKKVHGVQRVSVKANPGHTKHFQTLLIPSHERLILCDAPGLVFPSFVVTKARLVCGGILPIDQLRHRDFMPPLEFVCSVIPRKIFEETYGIRFAGSSAVRRFVDATALLEVFCAARGFSAGGAHGRADEPRGARVLLKDFVAGKLVHARPPPDFTREVVPTVVDEVEDAAALALALAKEQETTSWSKPSRNKSKRGRKHKAGKDPDPYANFSSQGSSTGKDVHTRKAF